MYGLLSWLRRDDESDYEKILSKLAETIGREEIRLAQLQNAHRRGLVWVTLYPLFGSLLYGFWWIGWGRLKDGLELWTRTVGWIVLLIFPMAIIALRKGLGLYYGRRMASVTESLSLHKDQQRLKVEELKKKTHYYTTRSLIERFDEDGDHQQGNQSGSDGSTGKLRRRKGGEDDARPAIAKSNSFNKALLAGGDPGAGSALSGTPSKLSPGAGGRGLHLGQSPATPRMVGSLPMKGQSPSLPAPRDAGGSQAQAPLPYPQLHPLSTTTPPRRSSREGSLVSSNGDMGQEPTRPAPPPPPRTWQDRVIDLIVGSDDRNILAQQEAAREREETLPDRRYALICEKCLGHNGLVRKSEYDRTRYVCPRCGAFNDHTQKAGEKPASDEVEIEDDSRGAAVENEKDGKDARAP